jgi:hypothetical protein
VAGPPLELPPKQTGSAASETKESGLVAWWKLDETSGTDVSDASGGNRKARVIGSPQWLPAGGKSGGALQLDGVKTLVDCGNGPEWAFRNGVSVAVWVKTKDLNRVTRTLVAKGNDTWRLTLRGSDGKPTFALNGPEPGAKEKRRTPQVVAKRSINNGEWHHVAASYDGQRVVIFVDGELEDGLSASGTLGLTTEPMWIGNNSSARGESLSGAIDDIRVYNRGLTTEEVIALYRGGAK